MYYGVPSFKFEALSCILNKLSMLSEGGAAAALEGGSQVGGDHLGRPIGITDTPGGDHQDAPVGGWRGEGKQGAGSGYKSSIVLSVSM